MFGNNVKMLVAEKNFIRFIISIRSFYPKTAVNNYLRKEK